jgi:hypothetical protein
MSGSARFATFHLSRELFALGDIKRHRAVSIERYLQSTYLIPLLLLLVGLGSASQAVAQQSATVTTLGVATANGIVNPIAVGTVVTLTASVSAGTTLVTPGTVSFCDIALTGNCAGVALVGRAQLTPSGTASIRLALSVGAHSLQARFVGTSAYKTSTSTTSAVTVEGTSPYATATAISSTPSSGSGTYNLTAVVTGDAAATLAAPSGAINFFNVSNTTAVLAAAPLTGGVTATGANFAREQILPASFSDSIKSADLNGDGKTDLLFTNPITSINSLTIELGNGDGTFQAPLSVPVGGPQVDVVSGDFNGDGKLDLAVVVINSGISVLLGNGDGTFQTPISYATGNFGFVSTADFNGDGNLDLVAGTGNCGGEAYCGISVLLGNGDGTFQPQQAMSTDYKQPAAIAIGDFNHDGKPDIALTISTAINYNPSATQTSILLGNGDGTFVSSGSLPIQFPTVGDFNGDGFPDLATIGNSGLSVLLGNGDGTFQTPRVYAFGSGGSSPVGYSPFAGDFNGDGKLDLAAISTNTSFDASSMVIWIGKGDGTFAQSAQSFPLTGVPNALFGYPNANTSGDFNDDGRNDLLVGNQSGSIGVLLNTSGPSVTVTIPNISVPGVGTQVIQANYGGDTNYSASTSNTVSVTGSGAPVTPPPVTLSIVPSSTSLTVAQTGTATDTIQISSTTGYVGNFQLSCSGLPTGATCSFQPASLAFNGTNNSASVVLTIQTISSTALGPLLIDHKDFILLSAAFFWVPGGFATALLGFRKSQFSNTRKLLMLMLLLAGLGTMTACGGGSSSNTTAPPTTTTMHVIVSGANNFSQSISLSLIVP